MKRMDTETQRDTESTLAEPEIFQRNKVEQTRGWRFSMGLTKFGQNELTKNPEISAI